MEDAKVESEKAAIGEEVEDGMQCNEHPNRSNPGGICALCLQEKLGNLVSSSFPLELRCSSSSSTSPSFRSDSVNNGASLKPTSSSVLHAAPNASFKSAHYQEYYSRRVRIPFMLAKRGKKPTSNEHSDTVFKRSKSTSICSGGRRSGQVNGYQDYSQRKKGFWSFLHLYPPKSRVEKNSSFSGKECKPKEVSIASASRKVRDEEDTKVEDKSSMERKVSRSRSVGCGSRSFSGDFFERISTGFADCTLRRVESQREGKPKGFNSSGHIKERVRCGGILGGFIITSSSSSYWGSSSEASLSNGRNKSWGWAFASPMRAFTRPATGRKDPKIAVPSITSIPSILSVRN